MWVLVLLYGWYKLGWFSITGSVIIRVGLDNRWDYGNWNLWLNVV